MRKARVTLSCVDDHTLNKSSKGKPKR